MADQKILDLEFKSLHMENSIDELNKEVYSLQNRIDQLESVIKKLSALLKQSPLAVPEVGPANEKPPHY